MVHRHPILYRMLSLTFLSIALLLMLLSLNVSWSTTTRATLAVCSLFSFLLMLSYASLCTQERRGLF